MPGPRAGVDGRQRPHAFPDAQHRALRVRPDSARRGWRQRQRSGRGLDPDPIRARPLSARATSSSTNWDAACDGGGGLERLDNWAGGGPVVERRLPLGQCWRRPAPTASPGRRSCRKPGAYKVYARWPEALEPSDRREVSHPARRRRGCGQRQPAASMAASGSISASIAMTPGAGQGVVLRDDAPGVAAGGRGQVRPSIRPAPAR